MRTALVFLQGAALSGTRLRSCKVCVESILKPPPAAAAAPSSFSLYAQAYSSLSASHPDRILSLSVPPVHLSDSPPVCVVSLHLQLYPLYLKSTLMFKARGKWEVNKTTGRTERSS